MIRRFLTVRWVAIHLLTIAIVVLFIFFGRWQLHRWESRGTHVAPPDSRPAVALSGLTTPDATLAGGSIGRQTTVTGHYDGAHQMLIADRPLAGRPGFWVVTPLEPGGPSPAGATALVVRGWVPNPADPGLRAPAGAVAVTGRVYASEDPPVVGVGTAPALPAGQYGEVNNAELAAHLPYRILDGYVLLAGQSPASAPAPTVIPAPASEVNSGGGVRNLAYAIQWWLFALVVLYFWVKLVREDLHPPEETVRPRSEPAPRVQVPSPSTATSERTGEPVRVGGSNEDEPDNQPDDAEDAELAAYNRMLAQLNARSGRARS